jgi:hypothetical protein
VIGITLSVCVFYVAIGFAHVAWIAFWQGYNEEQTGDAELEAWFFWWFLFLVAISAKLLGRWIREVSGTEPPDAA